MGLHCLSRPFWQATSVQNFRQSRICFRYVERSSGAVRTACDIQIDGRRGAGRPKLTWKNLMEKDCREWKLTIVEPQERST